MFIRAATFININMVVLIFPPPYIKAGYHVVLMIGFTEFCDGIRTKHVRK